MPDESNSGVVMHPKSNYERVEFVGRKANPLCCLGPPGVAVPRVAAGHCLRFCNESALSFRFALSEVGHATRRAVARRPNFPRRWEMPKTVMIVEDHELNMKLFHDVLEAHGYHTICTRDGFNVLDLARKHHPDLILMDIQLPEVSGLEVTKWLKEDPELKAIPVVAVTAFAMKGDEERIRKGGCEAYLSKPISV